MKRYLITALLFINSPAIADTTMTNNPISNSSGSVTNLGVMNMPSKQFTNTLSLNQVQCQGDTLVVQPFLTGNYSGDDPTLIRGYKTVKRFEKTNYAISPGISLSWNINLDRKSVRNCRRSQTHLVNLLQAKHEDARLSYELGRAKHCADLLNNGVRFKKGTKYEILCADIELVSKPNTLIDHSHSISEDPSAPFVFQKGKVSSPSSP